MTIITPAEHKSSRATAEAAWRTAKNDAWAAGLGRLVRPLNLAELSVPAIERKTKELRQRVEQAKKAAVI